MVDFSGFRRRLPDRDGIVAALDRFPAAAGAASPFVAGESVADAVETVRDVTATGLTASLVYLPLPDDPGAARMANIHLVEALGEEDLGTGNDLVVNLAHFGLNRGAPASGVRADVLAAAEAATKAGLTTTIAGVVHSMVDEALKVREDLADRCPDLGVTISANLHRSEADVLDLARAGARIRLVRRETPETIRVAFQPGNEIDKAYVRCLRMAVDGGARIVVGTHDPRLHEIAAALAERSERESVELVYQFRLGVLTERAAKLHESGSHVSVLIPFGPGWAAYVARRIALKPSSVGQAARALVNR